MASLGFTWFHFISLSFTLCHWVSLGCYMVFHVYAKYYMLHVMCCILSLTGQAGGGSLVRTPEENQAILKVAARVNSAKARLKRPIKMTPSNVHTSLCRILWAPRQPCLSRGWAGKVPKLRRPRGLPKKAAYSNPRTRLQVALTSGASWGSTLLANVWATALGHAVFRAHLSAGQNSSGLEL